MHHGLLEIRNSDLYFYTEYWRIDHNHVLALDRIIILSDIMTGHTSKFVIAEMQLQIQGCFSSWGEDMTFLLKLSRKVISSLHPNHSASRPPALPLSSPRLNPLQSTAWIQWELKVLKGQTTETILHYKRTMNF